MQLHLIRHAHAGSRREWDAPDELRPLSDRGWGQARAVAAGLADAGIDELWSSTFLRCRQTLEPLAEQLGLEIEPSDEFTEGGAGPVALDAALARVAAGRTPAFCSHGDVIPDVVAAAVRRGAELIGPRALVKGARYVCDVHDGQIAVIRAVGAPDGTT